MRQTQIFSGSSHPDLVESICHRLGQKPGNAELRKFSNGETSVQIQTSVRDQDVFIVQSGSSKINDNVMELLIMISACKGGSSKSITAVMPYFPYSRQSKKKAHRGAITARMIANLLDVAGVNHVITIDLHASQMQGFFKCPVDNLVAEPLIARWIKHNVPNWQGAVVVSKNPGGTKRVTSLADALKLSFGIVMTDRARPHHQTGMFSMTGSMIFEKPVTNGAGDAVSPVEAEAEAEVEQEAEAHIMPAEPMPDTQAEQSSRHSRRSRAASIAQRRLANGSSETPSSPLAKSTRPGSSSSSPAPSPARLTRVQTATGIVRADTPDGQAADEFTDERARDVITGRLIHGHIVDDNFPSPPISAVSPHLRNRAGSDDEQIPDHMMASFMSTAPSMDRQHDQALGGSGDAAASDDEEEGFQNPELETTVTLVGNVKGRPVFIVDDMIDKAGSWIAAAETVVKRGGATQVYCMATHGLFGGDCLKEMEECECIDQIVVTNTFPIPPEKAERTTKLHVIDVSNLLAEAIRRNHYGESISQLFMSLD